jgi:C1A family cysteine protease
MGKQLIATLLVTIMVLSIGVVSVKAATEGWNTNTGNMHGAAQTPFSIAPLNPNFVTYISSGKYRTTDTSTPSGYNFGRLPSPLNVSHLSGQKLPLAEQGKDARAAVSYPSSYDLRTLGRASPVKDQGACGACWAFATYASLESDLMPTEKWDFSENNMKNTHGYDNPPCAGGNMFMSTAYLARWSGPVNNKDDPYDMHSVSSPPSLPAQKHVQDVYYVPDRGGPLDNDNLKWAIMNYGAVHTGLTWDPTYYNQMSHAYYYYGNTTPGHDVAIVGWNDTFDRNKFSTIPPGDGAFIVKNSWGTTFGENGYFYVSYYDTKFGIWDGLASAVYIAEPTSNYQHEYQYDSLGWTNSGGVDSDTEWFANVFTATADERLSAISFYTGTINSHYEIYVYTDPISGPMSSTKYVEQTGTIVIPGYHTMKLSTTVPLTAGHKFSVAVKLQTPDYDYPVPMQTRIPGYSSAATASAGRSYISGNGTLWDDITTHYTNATVCLKAFTTSRSTPTPTPTPSLSITDARLVPNYPRYFEWSITNTGTADAWIAPDAMFYKPSAAAPGYAKDGSATGFYVWDGRAFTHVTSYGGLNWLRVPAGGSVIVYSQAVVPTDARWALYNANAYYNGSFQGWLYPRWDKYMMLR